MRILPWPGKRPLLKFLLMHSSLFLSSFFSVISVSYADQRPQTQLPSLSIGQHASLACMSCHVSAGVPNIWGMDEAALREKMYAYAHDSKQDTIMQQLLKGYSDIELNALAQYFSAHQRPDVLVPNSDTIPAKNFAPGGIKSIDVKPKQKSQNVLTTKRA